MSSTNSVLLRRLALSDQDQLAMLANNKSIVDNLRDMIPYPYSIEDAHYFINLCLKEEPAKNFAIEYEGQLVGVAGLTLKSDVERLSAEIGYWLGEPFWNKGIATRTVQLITEYGFESLELIRLYATVFEHNRPSMRVLEKCGFELEGILKKGAIKNNKVIDLYLFAKVR